jgi:hypothetical protein
MLPSGLRDFFAQHWVVGGIVASLAWFLAVRQDQSDKKPDAGIGWMCVALILILILACWAVVKKEWMGLVFAIGVLYIEVRSIRRASSARHHSN